MKTCDPCTCVTLKNTPRESQIIFDSPISVELNKWGWWRYPVSEDGGCGARGYGSVLDTEVPFSGFGQDGVNFCVDGRCNSILRIRELFHSQIIQQEIGKVMFHGKPDGWRILILRFGMSQSAVGWLRKGEECVGKERVTRWGLHGCSHDGCEGCFQGTGMKGKGCSR